MIEVPSETSKGKVYHIDPSGPYCDCPAFQFNRTKECKHIARVRALGLLDRPTSIVALLPEPATINCEVCGLPLKSIVEVPSKKHGTCMVRESRRRQIVEWAKELAEL